MEIDRIFKQWLLLLVVISIIFWSTFIILMKSPNSNPLIVSLIVSIAVYIITNKQMLLVMI